MMVKVSTTGMSSVTSLVRVLDHILFTHRFDAFSSKFDAKEVMLACYR